MTTCVSDWGSINQNCFVGFCRPLKNICQCELNYTGAECNTPPESNPDKASDSLVVFTEVLIIGTALSMFLANLHTFL